MKQIVTTRILIEGLHIFTGLEHGHVLNKKCYITSFVH